MSDDLDAHQWLSFDDEHERRTWVFDLTFLSSSWNCIYGRGCPGVLQAPAPELEEGCCSYGAHFTSDDDRQRVEALIDLLDEDEWQYRDEAVKAGGAIYKNEDDETMTRVVDGACIMLNRPGHPTGAGCALHQAALLRDESPVAWKPDVCWQLPLRLVDDVDDHGHVTSTLREWKRRDWGEGGDEFGFWCTEDPFAFGSRQPVYETLRDEIVAMVGQAPYDRVVAHLATRRRGQLLPHPALKKAQ